jgi:hypothetical protein
VQTLASDEMEGRAPSTPGGQRAADYIADQLEAMGVEPAGENGTYFQQVPIIESVVNRSFTLSVPGRTYRYLEDVVAFSGTEQARAHVQGDVVFVGHGIVAPEQQWNDYAGANVRGKWVLIMVNDPPATAEEPDLFAGKALTYYGRWTYKFEEAARQGAAGAILIHTDESATYPWQVVQSSWSGTQYSLPTEGVPALGIKAWMTNDAAVDLVRRGGHNLDRLRAAALTRGFKPVTLAPAGCGHAAAAHDTQDVPERDRRGARHQRAAGRRVHVALRSLRHPRRPTRRSARCRRIFNGAYDNASGVGGLLLIAQSMARAASPRPGRCISCSPPPKSPACSGPSTSCNIR